MQSSKKRASARRVVGHLASVLSSATWCASLIALGCAVMHEPIATRAPQGDEASNASAAGRASEAAGGGGGASDAAPAVTHPTWCDARAALERNCWRCHGEQPENGAPFSLVTYADTQVRNNKGKPRYESIAAAIAAELMPPSYLELDPPLTPLGADDRGLLLSWCEHGAPEATSDGCPTSD